MPKKQRIKVRKIPQQSRSVQMVEDILTAAIRVLQAHPGSHFTTILVSKEAGISVGSLYQYFPDKGSILFAVQSREWEETQASLKLVLSKEKNPLMALKQMMTHFFITEWRERDLRKSLKEAISEYKSAIEFVEMQIRAKQSFIDYLQSNFPVPKKSLDFWASFLLMTMTSLAEESTSQISSESELRVWSDHCTDMILNHFKAHLRANP